MDNREKRNKIQEKYSKNLMNLITEYSNYPTYKNKIIFESPKGYNKTYTAIRLINLFLLQNKDNKVIYISTRNKSIEYEKLIRSIIEKFKFKFKIDKRLTKNTKVLYSNYDEIKQINDDIYFKNSNIKKYFNGKTLVIFDENDLYINNKDKLIDSLNPKIILSIFEKDFGEPSDSKIKIPTFKSYTFKLIKKEVIVNDIQNDNYDNYNKGSNYFILDKSFEKLEVLKDNNDNIKPKLIIVTGNEISTEIKTYFKTYFKENKIKLNRVLFGNNKTSLIKIMKKSIEKDVLVVSENHIRGVDILDTYVMVSIDKFPVSNGKEVIMSGIKNFSKKYFANDKLNNLYFYHNIDNLTFKNEKKEVSLNIIYQQKLKKNIEKINLKSWNIYRYKKEKLNFKKYYDIFKKHANKLNLENNLEGISDNVSKIKTNGKITDIYTDEIIYENEIYLNKINNEIVENANNLSNDFLFQFPNKSRLFFKKSFFKYAKEKEISRSHMTLNKILVNKMNFYILNYLNEQVRLEYFNRYGIKDKDKFEKFEFNFPEKINLNYKNDKKLLFKKNVYNKIFFNKCSIVEQEFMKFIDNLDQVEWWFKNADRGLDYFSIPYVNSNNDNSLFYVDFIIKFKNGTLGLFDTKGGFTAASATEKADELQKYIKKYYKNKMVGGIVIQVGKSFMYNDSNKYNYKEGYYTNWKPFSLLK